MLDNPNSATATTFYWVHGDGIPCRITMLHDHADFSENIAILEPYAESKKLPNDWLTSSPLETVAVRY